MESISGAVFATVGWVGAVLIVVGYALVATRRVSSHSVAFHVITLLGSAGLTVYALAIAAWPNVALNGFMLIVAGVGVVMAWRVVKRLRSSGEHAPRLGEPETTGPASVHPYET